MLTPIQQANLIKLLGKAGFTDVTISRGITEGTIAIQDTNQVITLHSDYHAVIRYLVENILIQRVLAEP